MAAISITKARPCTPVGYEVVDRTTIAAPLLSDVTAGALLTQLSNGWDLTAGGDLLAHGIALQDGKEGQTGFDIGVQGEMDGFASLVPGAYGYPSASVAGGLDTTLPSGGLKQVRAVSTTRIRYDFGP